MSPRIAWTGALAAVIAGTLACAAPRDAPPAAEAPEPAMAAATTTEPAVPSGAAPALTPSSTPDASDQLWGDVRRALAEGRGPDAQTAARRYREAYPDGLHRAGADALLEPSEGRGEADGPLRFGAVLPLTGRYAKFGGGARRVIELAVRRHNARAAPAQGVEFRFEDSGGEPVRAAAAVDALAASGCAALLGPMTGTELSAAAERADRAGLALVSPAPGGRGAARWRGLFTIGVSPDSQADELARVSAERRYRRLALLVPRTPYGSAVAEAMRLAFARGGAHVVGTERYDAGQADFSAEIVRLGGTDAKRVRDEEEREKNTIQERTEEAWREILSVVAPGSLPASPTATPKAKRKAKRATVTRTATPSPSPPVTPELPRVVVFEWCASGVADDARLDRKFGARLALLLRQQEGIEILGGGEFLRVSESEGVPVDLERAGAEPALLEACRRLRVTHLVSGEAVPHESGAAVHTRVFDVRARRLVLDLAQVIELPSVLPANPRGLDAVVVAGRGHDVPLLASQLVFYDLRVPILGTADWDSLEIAKASERSLAGALFASPFHARSSRSEVREFVSAYGEAYAAEPDLWEAQTWDGVQLLLRAAAAGARDPRLIREELLAVRGHRGVTGVISIVGPGEAAKRLAFLTVRQGSSLEETAP